MTQIDMNAIIQKMQEEQKAKALEAKEARPKILRMMLENNLQIIKVYFAGSDDDGCIEDIAVIDDPNDNVWDGSSIKEDYPELYTLIEEYSYNYLESTGVDWVNNEGGQGQLLFDTKSIPPVFECIVEYNIMTTEIGHENQEVL